MTTPNHPPLSPAAQAVLTAFAKASDGEYVDGEWQQDDVGQLAAALRAAAGQFFTDWDGMCCEYHLNAIATELEGTNS